MRPAGGPYARSGRQIDRSTSGRIRATAAGHTQARACELAAGAPKAIWWTLAGRALDTSLFQVMLK
jgi:hypothetical protein